MPLALMCEVFDVRCHSPAQKLVLLRLADLADHDDVARVSLAALAHFCCMDGAELGRALLGLVAQGLLKEVAGGFEIVPDSGSAHVC